MKDLVSILLPVYNSERWIRKTIESLLSQTHKELQIVIVNDGSTDNSENEILSFKDSRICYYYKEHSGLPKTLNYGLQRCESDLVARIDADDYAVPDRIRIQLNFLKKNPEYGVVGTNFFLIDSNDKILLKAKLPKSHNDIESQLPRKCCLLHGSIIFNKNIINSINGYDENKKTAEDWDLLLKLIGKTKFYNIQDYLMYIRKHSSNISNPSDIFNKENEDVPNKYFIKILKESNNSRRIAKAHFDLGYFYYYENNLDKSSKLFTKAISLNPYNIQYLRYFFFSKYLKNFISYLRKKGMNKYWDFFRKIDRNNFIFRSKY